MPALTYGVATLLAEAYHNDDHETFDMIAGSIDLGTLVASTFQLAHYLLNSIPGGKLEGFGNGADIREEAVNHFDNRLSENTAKASAFSETDPLFIVTATTTIVMGHIDPLLRGKEVLPIQTEPEGINKKAFITIIASIAEASIDSFREYVSLTGIFPDLGDNPTYRQASDRLRTLLPRLTYRLEELGNHNI